MTVSILPEPPGVEAATIVAYCYAGPVSPSLDSYADCTRTRMPMGVRDRLLDHSEQLNGASWGEQCFVHSAADAQLCIEREVGSALFKVPLKRREEGPVCRRRGRQGKDGFAHLAMRVLGHAGEAHELGIGFLYLTFLQPFVCGLSLQTKVTEYLSYAVMQFARQALALLVGSHYFLLFEQALLGPFLLGDVVKKEEPADLVTLLVSEGAYGHPVLSFLWSVSKSELGLPVTAIARPLAGTLGPRQYGVTRTCRPRQQVVDPTPPQLLRRLRQYPFRRRVCIDDPVLGVHDQHALEHLIDGRGPGEDRGI